MCSTLNVHNHVALSSQHNDDACGNEKGKKSFSVFPIFFLFSVVVSPAPRESCKREIIDIRASSSQLCYAQAHDKISSDILSRTRCERLCARHRARTLNVERKWRKVFNSFCLKGDKGETNESLKENQ